MLVKQSALAVTFGVLLVLLVAPPARAETVHHRDARGDAPSAIDIRSVDYSHGLQRVRVKADIPDLGSSGSAALSISRFTVFEAGYVIQIKKRAGTSAKARLYYFDHFDLEPRRCSSVSGRWGARQIKLAVARRCLDSHARNRVFVQFGIQRGRTVDRAPAVRRLARG